MGLLLLAFMVGCAPNEIAGSQTARSEEASLLSSGPLGPTQAQQMYNWLINQKYLDTGLVESFSRTADPCLTYQASTYDQGLAGIMACLLGDCDTARGILEFFNTKWKEVKGFANFYNAINGRVGIEGTVHAGPNLWIALLALHYETSTGSDRYRPLAIEIARWAAALPRYHGGIAMGPSDEARGPWTKVVATEHNLDYYAVLGALAARMKAERDRRWIQQELRRVEAFLKEVAYDRATGGMNRGFKAPDQVDFRRAQDTITWTIAAIGPETLRHWGIDPERLIQFAETHFRVKLDGLEGFDFTDEAGAREAGRSRMISLEWTGQMINAYLLVAQDYMRRFSMTRDLRDRARAKEYSDRAGRFLVELDKMAIREKATFTLPYATTPDALVFFDGWRTPKASEAGGLGGSLAATAWRLFAGTFNPLQPGGWLSDQRIPTVQKGEARPHPRTPEPKFLPSSCTSAGLTEAAWKNLDAKRYTEAIAYADETIHRYEEEAKQQQKDKEVKEGCLIPYRRGDEKAKQRIFAYSALNDVAAALFVIGKAHLTFSDLAKKRGDLEEMRRRVAWGKEAFLRIIYHFSCAQVWDPRGWFWIPAQAVQREYPGLIREGVAPPSQSLARGGVFYVYRDKDAPNNLFSPSGWMGDLEDIDFDDAFDVNPYAGNTCTRITYWAKGSRGKGWAGIYWQHPENNWGDKPEGGYDLRGAKRLVFWARGERGGEKAEFKVGGINGKAPYPDSLRPARSTGILTLTKDWKRYEIDLAGLDLRRVIGGFVWVTNRPSNPRGSTIYVDEIRFEG